MPFRPAIVDQLWEVGLGQRGADVLGSLNVSMFRIFDFSLDPCLEALVSAFNPSPGSPDLL